MNNRYFINIKNVLKFEELIPETILARGKKYFDFKNVISFDFTDKTKVSAVVSGTEKYDVTITLDELFVNSYSCNCPHFLDDETDVCKHIVAVLYATKDTIENASIKKKKSMKSSLSSEIKKLIEAASKEKLQVFLSKIVKQSPELAYQVLTELGTVDSNTKDLIEFELKEKIAVIATKYYVHSTEYERGINQIFRTYLKRIEKFVKNKKWVSAAELSLLVLKVHISDCEHIDYQTRTSQNTIAAIWKNLQLCVEEGTSEKIDNKILSFTKKTFQKSKKRDCIHSFELVRAEILDFLTVSKESWTEVLDLLFCYLKEETYYTHLFPKFYSLAETHASKEQKSIYDSKFKNELRYKLAKLEFLIDQNQLEEARKLSKQKIFKERDYVFVGEDNYNDLMLKLAIQQNDKKEVVKLAETLFFKEERELEYYIDLLIDYCTEEEWFLKSVELSRKINDGNRYDYFDYTKHGLIFYEKVDMLERFYEFGMASLYPRDFLSFKKNVEDKDLHRFYEFFEQNVIDSLYHTKSTSFYTSLKATINKYEKFTSKKKVERLIAVMLDTYPNRPALRQVFS